MPDTPPRTAAGFSWRQGVVWAVVVVSLVLLFLPNRVPVGAVDGNGRALLSGAGQRLAAVTLLMAGCWLTQVMPIGVTSLLPLVLYPLLGIRTAREVSGDYVSPSVYLFLGGFVIALGIERWGLHRRIALGVVSAVGSSPQRIVLGFMLSTGFLSMWISNTASTLLMLPIGLALLQSLAAETGDVAASRAGENGGVEDGGTAALERLGVALMLGIAYSASIGGLSTLVGTPTNVQFVSMWPGLFDRPDDVPGFSAGTWMLAVLPMAALLMAVAWGLLVWGLPAIPNSERLTRGFFRERLRNLGPITTPEFRMAIVFGVTAFLWMTRTPLVFGTTTVLPGWSPAYVALLERWALTAGWDVDVKGLDDSTVAIGMMILLFVVPAGVARAPEKPEPATEGGSESAEPAPRLMDWETANRLPWEILLLFGGGLAIAGAFKATGLSDWLGAAVAGQLGGVPVWGVVLACCLLMTFLTEVTSNVATVSALLPVLAPAAVQLGIDPRLVCLPAVISASCAFMLPIATPPNAIVFGSGRVRMEDMVRYGIVLNVVGAVIITVLTFVFLVPQYGISFEVLPEWAR